MCSLNAGLEAALQPATDGTWVNNLWQSAKTDRDGGVSDFARFYVQLWQALDQTLKSGTMSQEALLPYLNALAFGAKGLLPALWRYLT